MPLSIHLIRPFAVIGVLAISGGCDNTQPPLNYSTRPSVPVAFISGSVWAESSTGRAPVAGVQVYSNVSGMGSALTDTAGRFALPGPTTASFLTLTAKKHGYSPIELAVSVSEGSDVGIVIAPLPTYDLSGRVHELVGTSAVPVAGVAVYCDACGEDGHTYAFTDDNGRYRFTGVYPGATPLIFRKQGFLDFTTAAARLPDVDGDTEFDVQLVRR